MNDSKLVKQNNHKHVGVVLPDSLTRLLQILEFLYTIHIVKNKCETSTIELLNASYLFGIM